MRAACSSAATEGYSVGSTFWVPASAEPAGLCQLEALALEIFRFHTAGPPAASTALPSPAACRGLSWDVGAASCCDLLSVSRVQRSFDMPPAGCCAPHRPPPPPTRLPGGELRAGDVRGGVVGDGAGAGGRGRLPPPVHWPFSLPFSPPCIDLPLPFPPPFIALPLPFPTAFP